MKKLTYSEKLKDQRWQKKRLQLLEAAGWKCQNAICLNESDHPTLQIHHRIYLRNKEPWEYEDWAYQVLCDQCHESKQRWMDRYHEAIAKHESLGSMCIAIDCSFDPELACASLMEIINTNCLVQPVLLANVRALAALYSVSVDLGYDLGKKSAK